MSSTPTSTYLSNSLTPVVRSSHRHKRSGAISGDFDIAGLGLLSPNPVKQGASCTSQNPTPTLNTEAHSSLSQNWSSYNSEQDISNRNFHFSNEEDFANKPLKEEFRLPSPNSPHEASKEIDIGTEGVHINSSVLNSPIRLKLKGPFSSNNCMSKSTLTDEALLDEHKVPDALIDLDRVLSASSANGYADVYHGERCTGKEHLGISDGTNAIPPNRNANTLSAFSASPYSSPAYLKQPIKEPVNDAIEEEEDNYDSGSYFTECMGCIGTKDITNDQGSQIENSVLLLPHEGVNIYHNSPNSPTSNLYPNQKQSFRELDGNKIDCSHSSRESSLTFVGVNGTPTPKRFSAKANRYQAFYEQSTKISSSLKIPSSESFYYISPYLLESTLSKETGHKHLEHSVSSLSLKSVKSRVSTTQSLESRFPREVSNSSEIFDACTNGTDFVCNSYLRAGITPENKAALPDDMPSQSSRRMTLPKQKMTHHSTRSVPTKSELGKNSKSTPYSGGSLFDKHSSPQPESQTVNFEISRRTTPTIVVNSEVESTTLASPIACNISLPRSQTFKQTFNGNEICEISNSEDCILHPSMKSTSPAARPPTRDNYSSPISESKSKPRVKVAKPFVTEITSGTSNVKLGRISKWFKRLN